MSAEGVSVAPRPDPVVQYEATGTVRGHAHAEPTRHAGALDHAPGAEVEDVSVRRDRQPLHSGFVQFGQGRHVTLHVTITNFRLCDINFRNRQQSSPTTPWKIWLRWSCS